MMTTLQNHSHKPAATIKIVPLGDEINRLQNRLGGLRRQTGALSGGGRNGNIPVRLNGQG